MSYTVDFETVSTVGLESPATFFVAPDQGAVVARSGMTNNS